MIKFGENVDEEIPQLDIPESPKIEEQESEERPTLESIKSNYVAYVTASAFAANGEYIAVAYPATSTTKTIWYVNALDNGEIPGGLLGGVNTLPCNSPTNLWNNINFKIHVSSGLITQLNPIQLKNS